MTPFTKQSELAHEAAELIKRMPDTHANLKLVAEALFMAFSDVSWADVSEVLDKLGETLEVLDEVRAFSDEEIVSWVKEHMDDQRRAA